MNLGVDAAAMYHFKQSIESYDLVLENCYNYVDWAIKHNCKVRFVSDVSHLYPEAGYMSFCENYKGAADMKFIQIRPGYEDYFKNKADAATETLAGLNMTDNPKSRLPVFGTEEMFEKYYKEHLEDISVWKDKAKQWFSHQRSNIAVGTSEEDRVEKERVLKIIHAYKEEGKKVYLASGKLVFDLAVKYTKGCAHVDMCHWITHTVETIKGNPNILLLIKPHPHETRKEITMSSEAVGTIADLIKTELGENTILLKGHWFRNIDIMEYIDVELTWGGTSSLEFQSQGITTLMADECAHDDYPIGFLKIKSIGEYENFLNDPASFHVREDLPDRALMFLAFLGSDDVLIKNKYTSTLGNNYGIHQSKINMGAVKEYVRNGDKELEGFFERLI
jgi:capsular polysaccharide export protein